MKSYHTPSGFSRWAGINIQSKEAPKAKRPRPSYKAAIRRKCKDCTYDPAARGTWLQQVTLCSVYRCPLYEYRPKTRQPLPRSLLRHYVVTPEDAAKLGVVKRDTLRLPQNIAPITRTSDTRPATCPQRNREKGL